LIGIDLVKISRIERFIERFPNKALQKFLNTNEIKLAKKASTAAGFWAAKEAASKALQTGIGKDCNFHDIEIYKLKNGAPALKLHSRLIKQFNITDTSLSITHDAGLAIAVVAIESSTTTNKVKQL